MKSAESKKIIVKIAVLIIIAIIEPVGTVIRHKENAFYCNNVIMNYGREELSNSCKLHSRLCEICQCQ